MYVYYNERVGRRSSGGGGGGGGGGRGGHCTYRSLDHSLFNWASRVHHSHMMPCKTLTWTRPGTPACRTISSRIRRSWLTTDRRFSTVCLCNCLGSVDGDSLVSESETHSVLLLVLVPVFSVLTESLFTILGRALDSQLSFSVAQSFTTGISILPSSTHPRPSTVVFERTFFVSSASEMLDFSPAAGSE